MNTPVVIIPAKKSSVGRVLLILFAVAAVLAILGMMLASGHTSGFHDGSLMFFDEDFSDSAVGWAIAIPILAVVAVIVIVVLIGTGVLVAGVLALALIFTLLALVLAFVVAILPILAFVAVPILAFIGLVNLLSRRRERHANYPA